MQLPLDTALTEVIDRALRNCLDNGYAHELFRWTPREIARELSQRDTDLERFHPDELTPHVSTWLRERLGQQSAGQRFAVTRVYNSGAHLPFEVPEADLEAYLVYQAEFRPGCAIFVNGFCVQRGYLSQFRVDDIAEQLRRRSHHLLTTETCPCDKTSERACMVCDGGLGVCAHCGAAESELSKLWCTGPRQ